MTKAKSGLILVAGPVIAAIGAGISSRANSANSTPDTDWWFSLLNGCGILTILVGLGMFFFGAMRFSRGS